ncbi:hypothetical protein [Pedobacter cryoconitis]|uniref:Uncharacterized protein n=1 Tax=Pedobacter cryoconitis TaxID=188932 RepID=A0A7X0J7M2_9SPHI|nr:hypothetical protein [Pedobacter cryoconitis]MBB6502585.1 hypothetical protein [Pedobacter cryoconitis]
MLKLLSMVFYFFAHHGAWSFVILLFVGIGLSIWRHKVFYVIMGFILAVLNVFTGQFVNAVFLAQWGTEGSAVVTLATETNSRLNDEYIWDYDVVVKTADGKDVVTDFSTTTASLYPIRNEIRIPNTGERFVVRYIPGFEKNIVIMTDQSAYGIKSKIAENLMPVKKAEAQYNVNPDNADFRKEYAEAMRKFIANPENASDTQNLPVFRTTLNRLETIGKMQSVREGR